MTLLAAALQDWNDVSRKSDPFGWPRRGRLCVGHSKGATDEGEYLSDNGGAAAETFARHGSSGK
jgi:hypothetical protein